MPMDPEDNIPTPTVVHDRLNVQWSEEAEKLLLSCVCALQMSQHVGASVPVPEGTPDAAVARVIKALEKKNWTIKRDKDFDQRDMCSWDNLNITTANNWQPCQD